MAKQAHLKSCWTRHLRRNRPREQRLHAPARFRSTGHNLRRMAQQEHRNPRRLGRKVQSPAGGQIIGFRLTPEFNHDGGQGRTARRIKPRLQHALHIMHANQCHGRRRHLEFQKPRRINPPRFRFQKIMPHPDDGGGLLPQQKPGIGQGKTSHRGTVSLSP